MDKITAMAACVLRDALNAIGDLFLGLAPATAMYAENFIWLLP